MKVYHQNGTVSRSFNILFEDDEPFAIHQYKGKTFYPKDDLVWEIDSKLGELSDKFINLYFPDLELYHMESTFLPIGLVEGGQESGSTISSQEFLNMADQCATKFDNLYRHLYLGDCRYLLSTISNLMLSAEHCFVQYYMQIARIEAEHSEAFETKELMINSPESFKLAFWLETFFTKLYSVLDLMVKVIYELEHPVSDFSRITKLKSAKKLWGDRKEITIDKCAGTIFEDCEILRQIESIRNEVVHNGSWESNPTVFLRIEDKKIVERYMVFPDFIEGRLATVKNRRHFFSVGTKVNDALVLIHHEFYRRLLATLQYII